MKFVCPLIVVEDIARSRAFYENTLGMKVKMDFGQNVAFEGDFAIHLKSHFDSLTGKQGIAPGSKPHNFELYFESEDLENDYRRLMESGAEVCHDLREQPWGQRVFRVYDPDGHIVEIGETLEAVVRRYNGEGMTEQEIHARIGIPLEFIRDILGTK
ncbi:MAG: hypothetical protein A2Y33_12045 [Spirochaetes bacterium GWF1_51_8]|nr:MAG: hypothetical protein A2Y33_12045 [Spirochaetes bacterium GWF1_51_8]